MSQMTCECGEVLTLSDPVFEIVNQLTIAAIIMNTGMMRGNVCGKCGQGYIAVIQGFDPRSLKLSMTKIPNPDNAPRIVAPNGSRFH
jgi:hypothetical protein